LHRDIEATWVSRRSLMPSILVGTGAIVGLAAGAGIGVAIPSAALWLTTGGALTGAAVAATFTYSAYVKAQEQTLARLQYLARSNRDRALCALIDAEQRPVKFTGAEAYRAGQDAARHSGAIIEVINNYETVENAKKQKPLDTRWERRITNAESGNV